MSSQKIVNFQKKSLSMITSQIVYSYKKHLSKTFTTRTRIILKFISFNNTKFCHGKHVGLARYLPYQGGLPVKEVPWQDS